MSGTEKKKFASSKEERMCAWNEKPGEKQEEEQGGTRSPLYRD